MGGRGGGVGPGFFFGLYGVGRAARDPIVLNSTTALHGHVL